MLAQTVSRTELRATNTAIIRYATNIVGGVLQRGSNMISGSFQANGPAVFNDQVDITGAIVFDAMADGFLTVLGTVGTVVPYASGFTFPSTVTAAGFVGSGANSGNMYLGASNTIGGISFQPAHNLPVNITNIFNGTNFSAGQIWTVCGSNNFVITWCPSNAPSGALGFTPVTNDAPADIVITNAGVRYVASSNSFRIENATTGVTNRFLNMPWGLAIEQDWGGPTNNIVSLNTNGTFAVGTRAITNGFQVVAGGAVNATLSYAVGSLAAITTSGQQLRYGQASTWTSIAVASANDAQVGVGSLAPTAKLHVGSGSNQFIAKFSSTTFTNAVTIETNGNLFAEGDVSALTFTDRSTSPGSLDEAWRIVLSHESKSGRVDHSKLDRAAWASTGGQPDQSKRDLSKVVSAQAIVIQDLLHRLEAIESKGAGK